MCYIHLGLACSRVEMQINEKMQLKTQVGTAQQSQTKSESRCYQVVITLLSRLF